ncbi:hypothetical protein ABBQ32_004666 [Trebouxia sp. C0010 RCD-2024]
MKDPSVSHLIDTFKLKKRQGCCSAQIPQHNTLFRLTKDCTTRMAFGVIPNGSDVHWQFAPLPTGWLSTSVLRVHAKVQDKQGTLRMALGKTGCLLQLSNQASGAFLDVHFSLIAPSSSNAARPPSGSGSASCSSGRQPAAKDAASIQADRSNSHSAASTSAPTNQGGNSGSGRVQFRYHFLGGQQHYHCRETTSNFACFACSQTCNGLLGLQQHIEASHDLFDFGYPKAEPGGCPTVEVRCPPDLYDQQGKLQTLETDDLHDDKGKEMSFFCPRQLRRQRVQQYSMTEHQRRNMDFQLTHNKFRKAAWKPCTRRSHAGRNPNKAARSARSGPHSTALPMRPLLAQPRHPETQARAASHAAASTSSSGNLAGQSRPAGSGNASGSGSGSAKLGRPPHFQAPPRKRPRMQRDPPTLHDVTGPPPVYFHARSCTRMTPQEVAHILQDPRAVPDSDDEEDQAQWKERAVRQLDNQTDLSAPERDLMLRWNLYLHDQPCLSDAQMSQRCQDFAALVAKDMQKDPNLRRCFMVHLINLWEFNLVPAEVVDECVTCIDSVQ